jgi:molybdopterin converting factor small subunit
MRVELRTMALPALAKALGGKRVDVDFQGNTVADLIQHLVEQYGPAARGALLDEDGNLDDIIQVLVNEKQWVVHDDLKVALKEGDSVILMLLVVGG